MKTPVKHEPDFILDYDAIFFCSVIKIELITYRICLTALLYLIHKLQTLDIVRVISFFHSVD